MAVDATSSFYSETGPTPSQGVELEAILADIQVSATAASEAAEAASQAAASATSSALAATASANAAVDQINTTATTAVANLNAAADSIVAAAVEAAGEAVGSFSQSGTGSVERSVADKLKDVPVTPEDFGAAGDGVVNDRAALQAAIDTVAARGGGKVLLTKRYAVSGGDLMVRDGVTLDGNLAGGGQMAGADYATIAPAILLNPANPIRLGRHSATCGFAVIRQGVAKPNFLRDCYAIQDAMAGTAIVLGDATNFGSNAYGASFLTGTNANVAADARVVDMFVLGFDLAVYSDYNSRVLVKNLLMDCRNGVIIRRGYDSCRVENLRSWPFLTGNTVAAKGDFTLTAVAQGATASTTRLTSNAAATLQVGDRLNVFGVTNFPTLNGRRVITAVNAAGGTIDVDAAYAPSGTPGVSGAGIIVWGNRRLGTMLVAERIDGLSVMGGYAYGMHRGFFAGDETNWLELHSCAVDDWLSMADPDCIGYEFNGSVNQCSVYGISSSSQARALVYNSTMNAHLPIFGGLLGATAQNVTGGTRKGITVGGGSVGLYGVNGGDMTAHLASGSGGLIQLGGSLGKVTADDGIAAGRYVKIGAPGDPGVKDFNAKEHLFGTQLADGTTFPKLKLNEDGTQRFGPRTSGSGTQLQLTRGTDKAVAAIISLGSGPTPQVTLAGDGTNNPNAPFQFGGIGSSANPQILYTMRYDASIAANSQVGMLGLLGTNAGAAATIQYVRMSAIAEAVTANAEKGKLDIAVRSGTGEKMALRLSDSRAQVFSPLQIPSYAVAALPAATGYDTPALVHCTNGDAGNPCLAVAVAGVWRKLAWGAVVSAS